MPNEHQAREKSAISSETEMFKLLDMTVLLTVFVGVFFAVGISMV